jgi:spore coat polysaccharide biosynthesis protein SpsF (cytidylyltransferase family)
MEDLKLVKEIIKNIQTKPIYIQDIIKLYKRKPKIFKINKNVKHDGYITSLKKDV